NPQTAFPYEQLINENRNRSKLVGEFELMDTGVFDENKYFDVFVEYAKADVEDIFVKITVANRAAEDATIHVLPTIWFRNRWTWDGAEANCKMHEVKDDVIGIESEDLGPRWLYCDKSNEILFSENETNNDRLFGSPNRTPYVKDGINNYVVSGKSEAINPAQVGTKAAAQYILEIPALQSVTIRL